MDEKITQMIQSLDTAREKMRAVLSDMDVTRLIYPPWTIKQVLAHITGWDDATTAALRAHAGGTEPGTPADRGIDHYNAQSVAERDALPYEHIVREWDLARDQLKRVLAELPPEKLAQPLLFPWGGMGTVAQIIAIMAHHETEHAAEITALTHPPAESAE